MTSKFAQLVWVASTVSSMGLGPAVAQPSPTEPISPRERLEAIFNAGLNTLGRTLLGIGSLGGTGGGSQPGAVWRVDLRSGERRLIGKAADLTWPVSSPDGTIIYAIRGRQVVRIAVADGRQTPIGASADWRKLIGVLPDGTVLGFVEGAPRPRPALLAPDGGRAELPPPTDKADQRRNAILLQESSDYTDHVRLDVRDSERGGNGRDVFLIGGTGKQNLTDCGDDICGQPSRSPDGHSVYYIRSPRRY